MPEDHIHPNAMRAAIQRLRRALEACEGDAERIGEMRREVERLENLLPGHNEDRFRLLVEAVEDYAIFMLDPHGTILSWNEGAERIKGYSADEIIGRNFSIFYLPAEVAAGKPASLLAKAARDGRYAEEGWRLRKNGERFWASVVITPLYAADGELRGFGKVTRDMTERKIAEETLRQSEERFRLLVEGVRDYAIFVLDPDGYITSWNAGAELIKGYSADEIIGRHFSTFYPPADVAAAKPQRELEIARRDGRYEEEGWRLRKDGGRFWASVVINALYATDGGLRGFAKVTRDLSERKRAQEERELLRNREIELEIERATRRQMELAVEARDQFFATASHELKTPLTTILGSAQLQLRRLSRNPQVPEAEQQRAQTILHQAMRLQRLINSLLDVTRLQEGRFGLNLQSLDLVGLARGLADELRPMLSRHQLALRLPAEPAFIEGDHDRLEQVLQNLLQNAIKYSPNGGTIGLEIEADAAEVRLIVSDTGIGIPPAEVPRIFERFYRGSNVEGGSLNGMGIGLYVVSEIIAFHGGTVEVTSQLGASSRFCLHLPRQQS
ncbi:MAG TPA: PAS domain S-box protein [Herpetosiphonaceae bacterium]|nr:PAS domain S-box protein [Herpetosiphonaceae bacterium]